MTGVSLSLSVLNSFLWIAAIISFVIILRLSARLKIVEAIFSPTKTLKLGVRAPNFSAKTISGQVVDQAYFLQKKVCLLFIGIDCSYCKSKYPIIRHLIPKAMLKGIDFVLVCQCTGDELQALMIQEQLEVQGLVSVPGDTTLWEIFNPSGGTPFFVFMDEVGEVRSTDVVGTDSWDDMVNRWLD